MNDTHRTVLILGANGRFGLAAAQAFAAAGWQVLAQARRPLADGMPASARRIDLPLTDTAGLVAAAKGASHVVYAVNPLYIRWDVEALPLANAGMDIAQALGAVFMLPGNVYAYGEDMPSLLSESTPVAPTNPKGRIRAAMEDELLARAAAGLRSVVLRAGDFFGGGTGNWFDQVVVRSLARGKIVYPGPDDVVHAWAYLPDLARSFVMLAERHDLPVACRLHFPGHALTGREFLDAVQRAATGLRLPHSAALRRGRTPWWAIALVAWAAPMLRELLRMSYLWRVPHRLSATGLRDAIGRIPTTPIDTALRDSLLALGHRPRTATIAEGI
ncbi:MAG: NAD-dependent epimerase/dehydratase family protein [Xanthomonadaceae bacterium]|jgi:nucleoside-diphosphate-sugar epimerase|nr:NAD-dependent epimerase/dehydratase family protein [Xanthomonadaceae bacterium]